MNRPESLDALATALQRHGMLIRGGFVLGAEDEATLTAFPALASTAKERTLVLVGNAGAALYDAFFAAVEPGGELDAWTRRVVEPIAAAFGARAAFPFGGPPWLPFQRWAMRAEGLKASPLGVLIHPRYGLWHAYRAVLIFDKRLDLPSAPPAGHPCDTCRDRPCLTVCPVGAVTAQGYAVDICARHVAGAEGTPCRTSGCLARRACPVGLDYQYPEPAMAFHMAAFLRGRGAVISHSKRSG
jgi:hypothetical protein